MSVRTSRRRHSEFINFQKYTSRNTVTLRTCHLDATVRNRVASQQELVFSAHRLEAPEKVPCRSGVVFAASDEEVPIEAVFADPRALVADRPLREARGVVKERAAAAAVAGLHPRAWIEAMK